MGSMDVPPHRLLMESSWSLHGVFMNSSWRIGGWENVKLEFAWAPHIVSLKSPWSPHAVHGDSMGTPCKRVGECKVLAEHITVETAIIVP
jgi:hypothetical protein